MSTFSCRKAKASVSWVKSGSGKTVLSRATMGLLPSTATRTGVIKFRGEVISELSSVEVRDLWGTGMAMIFQDPMTALNPVRLHWRSID